MVSGLIADIPAEVPDNSADKLRPTNKVRFNMFRMQKPLPAYFNEAEDSELINSIKKSKEILGNSLYILGHHYQRDEIIQFADARGDSLALSRLAAQQTEAKYIVFCGVHFMAEAADILTSESQTVILPDLNAGCSMADMANIDEVTFCWDTLGNFIDMDNVVPITYMNSAANLKAFVGKNNGSVCTSSNAKAIVTWALNKSQSTKILFFPDQHLGRNTAFDLGFGKKDMVVWDPHEELGGNDKEAIEDATFILWKGHCSIHQRFDIKHVEQFRKDYPKGLVVVHPECSHEVVEIADLVGSTDFIIKTVKNGNPGDVFGVGTEIHLVNRLASENSDKTVISLDPLIWPCATMFRIDLKHLAWILDSLVKGEVKNRVTVEPTTAEFAKRALDRMLEIV